MRYFIHDGKKQRGPFSIGELRSAGLTPEQHIWREGLNDWAKAGSLEELEELWQIKPPPFPGVVPDEHLATDDASAEAPAFISAQTELSDDIKSQNDVYPVVEPMSEAGEADTVATDKRTNESANTVPVTRKTILVAGILAIFILAGLIIFFNKHQKTEQALEQSQTTVKQQQETMVEEQRQEQADKVIQEAIAKQQAEEKAAEEQKRKNLRQKWFEHIDASVDSYTPVSLGGFTDIRVSVRNSTPFPIDFIEVQVSYWTANNYLFKAENVQVSNVEAGNTAFCYPPDSPRGSRLSVEIVKVTARAFDFCYDGFTFSGQNDDPYRCAD
jgi:hypothetical protein